METGQPAAAEPALGEGVAPGAETPAAVKEARTRPAAPITAVWAILIGTLALFPILCACLSALLLGKDITHTRELIAAANQPGAGITETLAGGISATANVADVGNPLASPLESPVVTPAQGTELAGALTPTTAAQVPTTITVIVETTQNPMSTPLPPTVMFQSPLATPAEPGGQATSLPPTFTPLPVSQLTATATPEHTATPSTPTPTATAGVTGTLTATPTPTSNATYTGSVRITMVMYTGTASINMSDQYVEVVNVTNTQVSIGNWTITSSGNNKSFMFYNGLVLQAGQTCRVYGNSPPQTSGGCGALSFNSSTPVWSTTKDTARLFDQNGTLMSTYSYP
jgi:hypothetical protein